LDNDLLPQRQRKLLPHQPPHHIDAAAGRIRHDHRDRTIGIILRRCRTNLRTQAHGNGPGRQRRENDSDHAISSPPALYAKLSSLNVSSFQILFEHDLFRKPESTFRDHALAPAARHGLHWRRNTGNSHMRFGLFGSATARHGGPDVDSGQRSRPCVEYNVEAEALGYHSTFLVEHHFTGFGQVSASLSLLTWLGARTRHLRLGTAVLVLPWHNPVLLAEQAATLDLLSGGRLDFGIGKGYRHNEFAGFCIPLEEGQARFEESIDIITKAWVSNERFDYRGQFWSFDDIVVE